MQVFPAILARAALPYGAAELVEWRWPSPIDLTVCESRHMIEMSLPPHATDGVASFPDMAPDRFHYMGSMFVRPAGVRVRSRSPGGHIRVIRLAVDPDAATGGRFALGDVAPVNGLDLRDRGPRVLLRRIRDELLCPGTASAELLRAYADALLIETARSIEARQSAPSERGRLAGWQYRRVAERIERAGPSPRITELAGLCGVSERHFTRLYRALTGESAVQSIARARARRAATLLAEGEAPIKAIAAELGFADGAAFSTAFRRAMGLNPGLYRQQALASRRSRPNGTGGGTVERAHGRGI